MEALDKDRMHAKLIDAQDVYDEEYPPGSAKRENRERAYVERVHKRQRRERIMALPGRTKDALVAKLMRKGNPKQPVREAAG